MPGQPRTKLFYKIGEVSRLAGVEPYILRYWETEFPTLAPRKNRGGQRVYQQGDLDTVLAIKRMLHEEGYTIAGARKKLAESASRQPEPKKTVEPLASALSRFKSELIEILDLVK
ncbi:MAG: MerR family transcriptional regulator [Nitrospirota bacterium]